MRQKKLQLLAANITGVASYTSEEMNVEGFDDLVVAVNVTAYTTGSAVFTIYHHFTYAGNDVWISEGSPVVSASAAGATLVKVSGPFTGKIRISATLQATTTATLYVAGSAHGIPGA